MKAIKDGYEGRRPNNKQPTDLTSEYLGDSVTAKLCSTIHDLLGPFDGRDPDTDGPIDLETSGAAIRKAQKVLEEVE